MTESEDRAARFTWTLDDIDILRGPFWDLAYRDGDEVVLVQDLAGLVRHVEQQEGYDGDLTGALDRVCAAEPFALAPPSLVADILAHLNETLPRTPPSPRAMGDGTARGGYGREVFERDGYRCRYCRYDLGGSYRGWLQLSVDHILPAQMTKAGYPAELIHDVTNLVTCCRSCNDFGNRWRVSDPFPGAGAPFFDLRDRVFLQRRARLALRHRAEESRYRTLVPAEIVGRRCLEAP